MWVYGLDWAGSGWGQVADACECGNEPSGSVKCGEFLDQLQTSQLLKKDSAPWSKLGTAQECFCSQQKKFYNASRPDLQPIRPSVRQKSLILSPGIKSDHPPITSVEGRISEALHPLLHYVRGMYNSFTFTFIETYSEF